MFSCFAWRRGREDGWQSSGLAHKQGTPASVRTQRSQGHLQGPNSSGTASTPLATSLRPPVRGHVRQSTADTIFFSPLSHNPVALAADTSSADQSDKGVLASRQSPAISVENQRYNTNLGKQMPLRQNLQPLTEHAQVHPHMPPFSNSKAGNTTTEDTAIASMVAAFAMMGDGEVRVMRAPTAASAGAQLGAKPSRSSTASHQLAYPAQHMPNAPRTAHAHQQAEQAQASASLPMHGPLSAGMQASCAAKHAPSAPLDNQPANPGLPRGACMPHPSQRSSVTSYPNHQGPNGHGNPAGSNAAPTALLPRGSMNDASPMATYPPAAPAVFQPLSTAAAAAAGTTQINASHINPAASHHAASNSTASLAPQSPHLGHAAGNTLPEPSEHTSASASAAAAPMGARANGGQHARGMSVADMYGDEDVDDDWAELLADLNASLKRVGQPVLNERERAVAVHKLIECTSTKGYEGAVDTAHAEIVRLRTFKAAKLRRAQEQARAHAS